MSEHTAREAAERLQDAVERGAWNNRLFESLPPRARALAIIYDDNGMGVVAPVGPAYSAAQVSMIVAAVAQWSIEAFRGLAKRVFPGGSAA